MISIIIPSYNSEKYIVETLDSVLAQTYRNFEVLVMNDCSKDRTAEIVEAYAMRDSRIHLVTLSGKKGVNCKMRCVCMTGMAGRVVSMVVTLSCW